MYNSANAVKCKTNCKSEKLQRHHTFELFFGLCPGLGYRGLGHDRGCGTVLVVDRFDDLENTSILPLL